MAIQIKPETWKTLGIIVLLIIVGMFIQKSYTLFSVIPTTANVCLKSDVQAPTTFSSWSSATWISVDANGDGVLDAFGRVAEQVPQTAFCSALETNGYTLVATIPSSNIIYFYYKQGVARELAVCQDIFSVPTGSTYRVFSSTAPDAAKADLTGCAQDFQITDWAFNSPRGFGNDTKQAQTFRFFQDVSLTSVCVNVTNWVDTTANIDLSIYSTGSSTATAKPTGNPLSTIMVNPADIGFPLHGTTTDIKANAVKICKNLPNPITLTGNRYYVLVSSSPTAIGISDYYWQRGNNAYPGYALTSTDSGITWSQDGNDFHFIAYATSILTSSCGNGVIDTGEQCDGTNLNGETCMTKGFTGGTLTCSALCTLVTTGCTSGTQTCSQLSGDVCTTSETCGGTWLSASDSSRCCSQTCTAGTCNTNADINCDNLVSRTELGSFITKWINNQATRTELGQAIMAWVNG